MITARLRASLRMSILAKVLEIEPLLALTCYDNKGASSMSYVPGASDTVCT